MSPLYLEDFSLGSKYTTAARTVTETDIVLFAGLTGDNYPLHTDSEFAAKTSFGGRIAHGMLGTSIIVGLWTRLGLVDGTALAFLETKWKYVAPIMPGDTIHAEIEVTQVKPSSKTGKGTVSLSLKAINQKSTVVQEGQIVFLIKARGRGNDIVSP